VLCALRSAFSEPAVAMWFESVDFFDFRLLSALIPERTSRFLAKFTKSQNMFCASLHYCEKFSLPNIVGNKDVYIVIWGKLRVNVKAFNRSTS
jgi:hypothetical protein